MIRKYRYGTPFDTEALTEKIETAEGAFPYGEISQNEGFAFTYIMDEDDIVYGLGESNRGINKRGYCYISNCTDDPIHTEDKRSLYGAHNFIIVSGKTTFGLRFLFLSEGLPEQLYGLPERHEPVSEAVRSYGFLLLYLYR